MGLPATLIGWKGYAAVFVAGGLLVVGVALERQWYGASQYRAGADAKQVEIEKRQAAIERARQEERDRADAQYRGAVLARQQTESKLAQAERDRDAAFARVGGLRKQLDVRDAEASYAGGRPDGPSPDWIGIFGQCVAEYESMGREAGRLADQVGGLQGYIRALQSGQPAH